MGKDRLMKCGKRLKVGDSGMCTFMSVCGRVDGRRERESGMVGGKGERKGKEKSKEEKGEKQREDEMMRVIGREE